MPCKMHGPNCEGDCIDPNVDNGMMTKVWGPPGWLFLHCITFGYPYVINPENPDHQNKKRDYALFFKAMGNVFCLKADLTATTTILIAINKPNNT